MIDEDMFWNAVCGRDARWDDVFVYAVESTKVYCRPTCASRRPRREGVRFFPTPQTAEAGGYRACRRCHPERTNHAPAVIERVRRACAFIARHADERPSLETVARSVGGSPHHLQRTFKAYLGISPREYVDACRIGCLKSSLQRGNGVAAATYDAGFGSGSRVYERAGAELGMTPATYAKRGKGEEVQYAIVNSPLGRLLVAATPRGVCSVKIGNSEKALEAELRAEYRDAALAGGDTQLASWTSTIVASLERGAPDPRLPLDIRATAFQRRVWQELQQIPRGRTRSYGDIAARIGRAGSARAVARACADNPVAVVIPCHRVVREDGSPGGYHWGAERKRALLEIERAE
jgi:AraC family transcriptional regulator, regulatory protein of adaptative response / methylated-DNA-[protein]-cysteine methyltransferase